VSLQEQLPGIIIGALFAYALQSYTIVQRLTRVEVTVRELRAIILARARAHREGDREGEGDSE
jgi:hypothetical protein